MGAGGPGSLVARICPRRDLGLGRRPGPLRSGNAVRSRGPCSCDELVSPASKAVAWRRRLDRREPCALGYPAQQPAPKMGAVWPATAPGPWSAWPPVSPAAAGLLSRRRPGTGGAHRRHRQVDDILREVAGHEVTGLELGQRWLDRAADLLGFPAPRVEPARRWWVDG